MVKDAIRRTSEVKGKSFSHISDTVMAIFKHSNNCCYYHTAQRSLHVQLCGDLVHTMKCLRFGSLEVGITAVLTPVIYWKHCENIPMKGILKAES